MRYCKDCKHFALLEFTFMSEYPLCRHPMNTQINHDLIKGANKEYKYSCGSFRENDVKKFDNNFLTGEQTTTPVNTCGSEAQYFEPSLWYRIKCFFGGK